MPDINPTRVRSRKYLVVDDHAGFRKTLRDFLPGHPVEIVECSSGVEAVAAFDRHRPDWTLMDIEMPGMDGLNATRAIRSLCATAQVIIVTQHDSPELREEACAAGATAFVLKDRLKDVSVLVSSLLQPSPSSSNPNITP